MARFPAHQPPPAPIVAELMRAGLSFSTAMAMERWKAQEVLELLRPDVTDETLRKLPNSGRADGTI